MPPALANDKSSMRMCVRSRTFTMCGSHHCVEREFGGARPNAAMESHGDRRAERALERRAHIVKRAHRPTVASAGTGEAAVGDAVVRAYVFESNDRLLLTPAGSTNKIVWERAR